MLVYFNKSPINRLKIKKDLVEGVVIRKTGPGIDLNRSNNTRTLFCTQNHGNVQTVRYSWHGLLISHPHFSIGLCRCRHHIKCAWTPGSESGFVASWDHILFWTIIREKKLEHCFEKTMSVKASRVVETPPKRARHSQKGDSRWHRMRMFLADYYSQKA